MMALNQVITHSKQCIMWILCTASCWSKISVYVYAVLQNGRSWHLSVANTAIDPYVCYLHFVIVHS